MKTDKNGHGGTSSVSSEVGVIDPNRPQFLPNSRKIYISGEIHPDVQVPFREISLAPTCRAPAPRTPPESTQKI